MAVTSPRVSALHGNLALIDLVFPTFPGDLLTLALGGGWGQYHQPVPLPPRAIRPLGYEPRNQRELIAATVLSLNR